MKNFDWKKLVPHVIAIGIFLIVAIIYCKPAFQGKVLQQTDVMHWRGMAQSSFEYKDAHGHFPLWNTHLFSGMPNYHVAMESKSFLIDFNKLLSLGLPKPVNFFFLACVCFYILSMAFGINYLVAILGSLAYAYSTYDPVIIAVGHDTKMMAIAFMPGLLAGLVLLYKKKYVAGLMVTALFASLEIGANHPQINYYFIIIAGFMTVAFIIKWIKEKQWKHMSFALALALLGGLIGVGNSAVALMTTSEYSKYTMRGGKTLENTGTELKQVNTTGLDANYALAYSIAKTEFFTFLMPNAFGGSSTEGFDENSKIVTSLTEKNVPENNAVQIAAQLPRYWGGIADVGGNPSTSGPVYFGAVICLLFIIGIVVVKDENKWWILAAAICSILLAWGNNFLSFNTFLLNHLPLYNKFRAPSMALVIPQLLFPLMAVLCLQQIFFSGDRKTVLEQNFKKILYAIGGVFAVLILMYLFNDYSSMGDQQIIKGFSGQTGNEDLGRSVIKGMIDERRSMFGGGIIRALIFAGVTVGALYLYLKGMVKPAVIIIAFIVVNTIDLFTIDSKYLNSDNYLDAESYQSTNFEPSAANLEILKDKDPHFRVYNLSPDRFNEALTAYFHRCIGGYHPAKLSIYQDLIENQISKNNMSVLNMLDTRYFMIPSQQQRNQYQVQRNDSAMGACWFVKNVQFVNGPVEEMKALDRFDPAQTAFVDNSFKSVVGAVAADPAAKISLTNYDADDIRYSTSATGNQFAVFSEIYYPAGWNAYIDGKKTDYCKTNYVLRGLSVPAGNHTVEFKFEPKSYYSGQTMVYIANILLWLSIAASIFFWWRQPQSQPKIIRKL